MTLPSVPFNVKIDAGATVYSPSTGIEWGTVKSGSIYTEGTVVAIIGDKVKIGIPVWSNGKEWLVKQANVHLVIVPPTITIKPTKTVIELDDGSQWQATEFTKIA